MSDTIDIEEEDGVTTVYYFEDSIGWCDIEFEIAQDPIVGDWCVCNVTSGGAGEFYVETRGGAIQYVLQRCGVIEEGEWTRAPERCV